MNFPIAILLFCTMCGLVDKVIGGRFGLAEEFDRGMTMMGSLSLTMAGIYCFAVMLGRALAAILQTVSLPFDPTILVSSVLAVDMGAYSIADTLCTDPAQKIFSGVLLASTLGCTISFSLPIALGSVPSKDSKTLMTGMVYGIIATPAALIVGGLMAGMGWDCASFTAENGRSASSRRSARASTSWQLCCLRWWLCRSFSTPRRFSLLTRR